MNAKPVISTISSQVIFKSEYLNLNFLWAFFVMGTQLLKRESLSLLGDSINAEFLSSIQKL